MNLTETAFLINDLGLSDTEDVELNWNPFLDEVSYVRIYNFHPGTRPDPRRIVEDLLLKDASLKSDLTTGWDTLILNGTDITVYGVRTSKNVEKLGCKSIKLCPGTEDYQKAKDAGLI